MILGVGRLGHDLVEDLVLGVRAHPFGDCFTQDLAVASFVAENTLIPMLDNVSP
jgi:hypothetical protein